MTGRWLRVLALLLAGPLSLAAAHAAGPHKRQEAPPILLPYGEDGINKYGNDGMYDLRILAVRPCLVPIWLELISRTPC